MHTLFRSITLGLIAIILAPAITLAQISNTPEVEKIIRNNGQKDFYKLIPVLSEKYSALIKQTPADGVKISMDVPYGPDPKRHLLDIHQPASMSGKPFPVLVFIHGGGFTRGTKNGNPDIYSNIGNYFARHGIIGINATYRLAPDHPYPAGTEDIAAIVRWLKEHVDEYGGDPARIFLMGHSAGAAHVASYALNEDLQINGGNDGVAGAILVSGVYSIVEDEADLAYYGSNQSLWPERTLLNQVDGRKIPLFIIDAQYDMTRMQISAVELMLAACKRDDVCPWRMHVPGHNHTSIVYHINTVDDSYGREVLAFIRQNSNR